jgi:hypothetical protein
MVTRSAPTKSDFEEAMFVISKAMRNSFTYEKLGDIPDETLIESFNLDKIVVDEIEHRESSDIIHCSLHTSEENVFTLLKIKDNEWIQDWGKMELKESPLIFGCVAFYGDDLPSVFLKVHLNDKELYYKHYINSEKWRLFRNKIFKERGFQCELCDNKKNLQLHHITYENFGRENDLDVMILCQDCHNLAHSK